MRSAVSARTETGRMPWPVRSWPSHCLRCSKPPTEWTPIRSNEPPHLVNRRRINPVFRVTKFHAILLYSETYSLCVLTRALAHLRTRDMQSDRLAIARLAEITRERFFHDDMFAAIRGANGEF